ncbi:hypothetical protein QIH93_15150 [Bradyrhizobium ottawaense]|jgi:hypothetical protein|uniref:hypothetical protein n=1 Tax=Bradyrhizobium ottawaense TaxID=931866 RepID=UPI002714E990|nr:hypothetical protein [Bradyrhizobium ottawaense]WLB49250.1 hypothetical protein QIH93_15150 [Bradyrhizobium ottawaense]
MTHDELQWMHLKDQYSELARAAGSPSDAWFGDPLESHEQVLERIKALAERVKEMEWKPVSERPEWDMQPGRQFIRIEGSRHHSGVNWHRVYFGTAFIRKPGAIDELHGYRDTDIIQLCDEGDMDVETVKVTHWAPAKFSLPTDEERRNG